ncbi:Twin-arginine translocation pathway signal sequence domain-containing protein [Betaproteobacteria bacterium GR16-43]|nr:Twin-arginine translocation pathway signal sequence domain-containing protein [Betaproteobacteria bacterium GR16-43]
MKRRDFLRYSAAVPLLGTWGSVAFAAPAGGTRNLLVLVELKGGNDGLNTVVPYADPAYRRLRARTAIERDAVLQLTPDAGLNPGLEKLMPVWSAKQLAIVQGLGYPQPNLSHFRSIEIWDTASKSEEYLDDGWLARAFARSPSPASFAADGVVVGAADMGPLNGAGRAIALTNPEQFLRNARLARDAGATKNASLAHILRVEREIVQSAEKLDAGRRFETAFPTGPFGNAIRTAAQLAANPAGIAVIRVTLGGFDTHANQLGTHANLMRQLGEGLGALREALIEAGRWETTVVATYSEFGRRPASNQSGGTDHGTASAHLVMGGKVRGGLYGAAPKLDRLDGNGNLPFAVDFRSYYATILDRWWGMDANAALQGRFPTLEFLV